MKINLKNWKVKNISFNVLSKNDEIETQKKNLFNLGFGCFLHHDKKKYFGVGFKTEISDEEFTLNLDMEFYFETDEDLDEDFKNSPFAKINAPAIAFPYLRSFISNLTLQSGFSPIILPSINFVGLERKDDTESVEVSLP